MNKQAAAGKLPPGQMERDDFPRFGMWKFADYQAEPNQDYKLQLDGDIHPITLTSSDLVALDRVELVADFHCVTTWTYTDLNWSGYRFRDVYERFVQPQIPDDMDVKLLVFRGKDHYKSALMLDDALADDVLLVDCLGDTALNAEHGMPLRLIAPAHYGYKSVKHLHKIDFWRDENSYRQTLISRIMQHPRARVAYEERARFLPGWFYRYLYRPLIKPTVRKMKLTKG